MAKIDNMENDFKDATGFLERIPAINSSITHGIDDGFWWVKFQININHKLAWNVVQELGHVLNYISVEERLPTTFQPVSPPVYMNGGPKQFSSWVIENTDRDFTSQDLLEWLEGRLPNPVDSEKEWET